MPAPAPPRPRPAPAPTRPPFESIYGHGLLASPSPRRASKSPHRRSTPQRPSSWHGKRPRRARCWCCFPSWASRRTRTKTCSSRTRCSTLRWTRSRKWSTPAASCHSCWWSACRCESTTGCINCGVVIHRGRLLGVTPKTYLPNYREFYEKRQFASGLQALATDDPAAGPGRAVRLEAALRGDQSAGFRAEPRDLRGRLGAAAAEHAGGARWRDGDRESLGERRHGRQGRLPAPALRVAVGEVRCRRICTRRRAPANRRPMSPGTATR